MRKFGSAKLGVALSVAIVGALVVGNLNQADARPPFPGVFTAKYPDLADKVKEVKCGVCHVGEKKTDRNDYGQALTKALGEKNVKDKEKIAEALVKVEKEKSGVEGKTFGDLIKEGKLPGGAK